jgi:hypothetical protein
MPSSRPRMSSAFVRRVSRNKVYHHAVINYHNTPGIGAL